MADGSTKLQTLIERMEKATEEAREVMRDLHGATKDARQVHKELEEQAEAVCVVAHSQADEIVGKALEIQVKDIPRKFSDLIDHAEKQVEKRFADLEHVFLDESSSDGKPSMSRIAEAVHVFRQLIRTDPRFQR
jgi:F0F1-type ATP synthase membrane subunit b/b'